jgi:hypothetical protein
MKTLRYSGPGDTTRPIEQVDRAHAAAWREKSGYQRPRGFSIICKDRAIWRTDQLEPIYIEPRQSQLEQPTSPDRPPNDPTPTTPLCRIQEHRRHVDLRATPPICRTHPQGRQP